MLFLDPVNTDASNMLTAAASWNTRYIHESSHWARFHGSSIGVLLTMLRRTRDLLAAHTLSALDARDIATFSHRRSEGSPIFSYADTDPENRLGKAFALKQHLWLDLHSTYQLLLDPRDLRQLALRRLTKEAVESALGSVWFQSSPKEMAPRISLSETGMNLLGDVSLIADDEGLVSTRLLFECAAVLDEVIQWAGSVNQRVDRAVLRIQGKTFDGDYGIPYRFAEKVAGCNLEPFTVLAMIDFALNPVVPGLHDGSAEIEWQEIHPPSRFARIAEVAAEVGFNGFADWPTKENVRRFHSELEKWTGLRMGTVSTPLSNCSSLRDCTTSRMHYAQRIPELTLFYSAHLLRLRSEDPHLLSHFGVNFVGPDACNYMDPGREIWSIFPPLRVAQGMYCWPSEYLTIDDATVLFLGAAISAAYDDAVHGCGALDKDHLPYLEFQEATQVAFFNEEVKKATNLPVFWVNG